MHVLNFFRDNDDYQAAIFASNEWRAAQIWEAIGERFWLMPEGWLGSELDTWLVLGRVRHEREACARCAEGIGIYNPRQGWTILPLDYDGLGIAPPDPRR
ncbi:hypothetical protein NYR55_04270 [Sphingomonas sp. BGYR3]|uniref:hypothetical protein n=1 Tax=Sphingomonas sp. BGYR3 TaxID=2975483 RepID=UPI0021A61D8A|nr:hypothetical protein [Sphingomonas sp. BGYR3]MDG5487834.1 hypothetical protein [Sphingomonas sp. BGYR3]